MHTATSPLICIAGKNEIAVNALLYLINNGWQKNLSVSCNKADDGQSNWQPSLKRFADEFAIPILTIEDLEKIQNLLLISLEFDRLIRPDRFETDRLYNIHFSMLPAYKGMYTSAMPILNGEQVSGVTLHKIDHGIDTGPIIAQTNFDLPEYFTARDLYFKYMETGFQIFQETFDLLASDGTPDCVPQPAKGSTYYPRDSIDYRNLSIDLKTSAEVIVRQLKAFSFREFQNPVIANMEIGKWEILSKRSLNPAGSIQKIDDKSAVLSTVDYDLWIERTKIWDWFRLTTTDDIRTFEPKDIDVTDRMGRTPLIYAAYRGQVELCEILLDFGADPNCSNKNGTTPLMYSYSSEKSDVTRDVVELLLRSGANPLQKDFFGRSLYDYHPEASAIVDNE